MRDEDYGRLQFHLRIHTEDLMRWRCVRHGVTECFACSWRWNLRSFSEDNYQVFKR